MKRSSKVKVGRLTIEFDELKKRKPILRKPVESVLEFDTCISELWHAGRGRLFIGIDPGIAPLTVAVIYRLNRKRRVFNFSFSTTPQDKSWQDRYNRITDLSDALNRILALGLYTERYICIEGYSFGSKGAVYTLAEIKQSLLEKIRVQTDGFKNFMILPPTTWKACIVPKKKVPGEVKIDEKLRIQSLLVKKWPELINYGKDHNRYDAYAMAATYEGLAYRTLNTKSALRLIKEYNIPDLSKGHRNDSRR